MHKTPAGRDRGETERKMNFAHSFQASGLATSSRSVRRHVTRLGVCQEKKTKIRIHASDCSRARKARENDWCGDGMGGFRLTFKQIIRQTKKRKKKVVASYSSLNDNKGVQGIFH